MTDEILEILQKDARRTPDEIAAMLGKKPAAVKREIRRLEQEGVILKYKAVVNRELLKRPSRGVRALIEVKTAPQKDVGFDRVAERIYLFPEVQGCILLSGGYDLLLVVEGVDIQGLASFVAQKLAPMEHVRGTVTHFLLKKYKEDGDVLVGSIRKDRRLAVTP